jgi:hypothetical protein
VPIRIGTVSRHRVDGLGGKRLPEAAKFRRTLKRGFRRPFFRGKESFE